MMLVDFIRSILYEGRKEDLLAKYPDLAVEDVWEADPSSTKKYVQWMLKQLATGASLNDIAPTIQHFDKHAGQYKSKDINSYKTLKELEDETKRIELSGQTKTQQRKENKAGAHFMVEDENGSVYRIDTKAAAVQYGKGTRWCITMENANYFNDYTSNNVIFYFYFSKNPPQKKYEKVAFAIQRDEDNSILKTEIFDAEDRRIEESLVYKEVGINREFVQLMESDATKRPASVEMKLRRGITLEKHEITNFIESNNYKTTLKMIIKYVRPLYYQDWVKACPKSQEKLHFLLTHYEPSSGQTNYTALELRPQFKNDPNLASRIEMDGDEVWLDEQGYPHREGGPAVVNDGKLEYLIHGVLHRDDGPAIVHENGDQRWYKRGVLHRDDGPAFIAKNFEAWYQNGKISRQGGPAQTYFWEGTRDPREKFWLINGKYYDRPDGKPNVQKFTSDGRLTWEEWRNSAGQKHRLDGPATIAYNPETGEIESQQFFINGLRLHESSKAMGSSLGTYDTEHGKFKIINGKLEKVG